MRVLNAIPRENAADYRRVLTGRELPKLKPAPGTKRQTVKCMVEQFCVYDEAKGRWAVQLARYIQQPKRFVAPQSMDPRQAKRISRGIGRAYSKLRDETAETFEMLFPRGLPKLGPVEFVRFSPRAENNKTEMDGDNLGAAFKAMRDGLSRYARDGHEWRKHKDTLGQADGWLEQQGASWHYRQAKHPANYRLHGVQIILHCVPRAEQP
jgi:hypothetical protein